MNVQRINRPNDLIMQIDELKAHARVDFDDDDFALSQMALAATREAEDRAQIALLHQRVRVTIDAWPRSHSFRLPIGPLQDFDSVTVTADGQPFEDFSVVTGLRPELRIAAPRPSGEIAIEYTAGFGEAPHAIPEDLKQAILDQVATYYDARGAVDQRTTTLSPHFARVIGRYRGVRA